MKYIMLLLSVILVAGCIGGTTQNATSNITENASLQSSLRTVAIGDHVAVDYTGKLENGTVFDTSTGRAPLDFDVGQGEMIKGFDNAVIGMYVGEEKTVTIKPEDAYGFPDMNNTIEIPIENVPKDTKIGDVLYSGTQAAKVLNLTNETVLLDLNHPLAGQTLVFDIKLVKIY